SGRRGRAPGAPSGGSPRRRRAPRPSRAGTPLRRRTGYSSTPVPRRTRYLNVRPLTGRLMAGGSVVRRVRAMPATREDTVQKSPVTIRDFEPEDYPSFVEIANLLIPDSPTTVEEERFFDERFNREKIFHRRVVAVDPATG